MVNFTSISLVYTPPDEISTRQPLYFFDSTHHLRGHGGNQGNDDFEVERF
jgi:hypothetical protein